MIANVVYQWQPLWGNFVLRKVFNNPQDTCVAGQLREVSGELPCQGPSRPFGGSPETLLKFSSTAVEDRTSNVLSGMKQTMRPPSAITAASTARVICSRADCSATTKNCNKQIWLGTLPLSAAVIAHGNESLSTDCRPAVHAAWLPTGCPAWVPAVATLIAASAAFHCSTVQPSRPTGFLVRRSVSPRWFPCNEKHLEGWRMSISAARSLTTAEVVTAAGCAPCTCGKLTPARLRKAVASGSTTLRPHERDIRLLRPSSALQSAPSPLTVKGEKKPHFCARK